MAETLADEIGPEATTLITLIGDYLTSEAEMREGWLTSWLDEAKAERDATRIDILGVIDSIPYHATQRHYEDAIRLIELFLFPSRERSRVVQAMTERERDVAMNSSWGSM